MVEKQGPFWNLYEQLKSGDVSRREFISRAAALGVGMPIILFVLNAVKINGAEAAPRGGNMHLVDRAQDTPAKRPDAGTEGQTRGAGGELKLLQWQAVTHLSLHNSQGTKDTLGASLVTEPLINYLPDGTLIPTLVKEVPSVDTGGVPADLTTVTYHIADGILWSDGEPFTAADVKFTYDWIMNKDNQATDIGTYQPIKSVETPDDMTVVITFTDATLNWYVPFSGVNFGAIYPKHILETGGDEAFQTFRQKPVGTGPYMVDSFSENDQVVYVINPNYREPNKPFFEKVNLKGGGDATSAAQAVLQTGDWDFAWNLQVEKKILDQMQADGGKGKVVTIPGTSVERVLINFSDPNQEVNGERAEMNTPHPFLSDKAVRQALALACDRQTMSDQFYQGAGTPPGRNILTGIPLVESPNTTWEFNLDKAKQTLDDAGWVMDGDTRKKDGVELKVSYSTSINAVRQKEQAVNKQGWEELGFKVQLKQVDAGIFFDSSAGNDQNASHFFNDLEMYTNNASFVFPLNYMQSWYAGPNGANIAQKSNGWSGVNESRYNNPDFDALYDAASKETDPEKAAQLFIQMNDIVINEVVVIPLVQRSADTYAITNSLNPDNVAESFFEQDYWNIANWNRVATS